MAVSRTSRTYCGVFGCKTFYSTNSSISFHLLPKVNEPKVIWINKLGKEELVDRRQIWAINLKMGKETLKKSQLRVCSLHFTNDFFASGGNSRRKRLKSTAIPSVNLPKSSVAVQSPKKRCSPKKRLVLQKHDKNVSSYGESKKIKIFDFATPLEHPSPNATCEDFCAQVNHDHDLEVDDAEKDENCIEVINDLHKLIKYSVESKNNSTQVSSGDLIIPFITLIDSPKTLNTMTGIPSFELLDKIVELYSSQFQDKRLHSLTYKERIILIFMKLKQDLSFIVLSILFKSISPESCRLMYTMMIPQLAHILNSVIYWPSKQEVLSNIPYCFEKFKNTRVIVDCTEIAVQKPKCLTCRIKTYSNYKSTFTVKFLISISPGGLITFISQPYGGRASDKTIFEQSRIIEMMEISDAIMVDKGFLIDDLCVEKQIELIRPPFLKNKKTFSKAEALLNKNIASARVHIERINQRLKMFKIFQNKFMWSHSHLANDIMIIIGGVCNLSSPIFANDKFCIT